MRLGIVVPRYGPDILGGAESFARKLAEHLPSPEFEVVVLTTCMNNVGSGENVYPAGWTHINGVSTCRFPVDHRFRNVARFHELTTRITRNIPLTVDEEYEWIDQNPHSPALYSYLVRHGPSFDLLLCVPYLYGITIYASALWPERTVLWPCLHDESFAHFLAVRLMLTSCRGLMLNSEAEETLLRDRLGILHPRTCIVGGGVEEYQADPARFRHRWRLREPFLLYAGRLDEGKNLPELVRFFAAYKEQRPGPLKLVLMGAGSFSPPPHPDIIPIGFQSERDKLDVYAAATLLVQPSLMESFSIVLMESWLAGVPVLVHGGCDVTRHHVERSSGGLWYASLAEFIGALDWLMDHPAQRKRMGELGRAYVRREYNWDTVLNRFRAAIRVWLEKRE